MKIHSWKLRWRNNQRYVARIVHTIRHHTSSGDILCLQDVGLLRSKLVSLLNNMAPNHWFIDWDERDRCGASIIIGQRWALTQVFRGYDTLAWAGICWKGLRVRIGSINTPSQRRLQWEFWTWFEILAGDDRWILVGEFNLATTRACPVWRRVCRALKLWGVWPRRATDDAMQGGNQTTHSWFFIHDPISWGIHFTIAFWRMLIWELDLSNHISTMLSIVYTQFGNNTCLRDRISGRDGDNASPFLLDCR